ncbi:hypothetical protein MKW94_016518, partial [Papaver nudicaule]|nr:hypothetical protein [Papaver nudicaule]
MSNGICTAVLRGHSSLVKGVCGDPIGSFIASQSDDKTVIIWRTSDWSLAHKTDGHWAKSLGSTFFRRLDWSPYGHFITTAPVLLGHNAPIICVKFNHSMFRKNSSNGQDVKAVPVGWANGSSKNTDKVSQPYNMTTKKRKILLLSAYTWMMKRKGSLLCIEIQNPLKVIEEGRELYKSLY